MSTSVCKFDFRHNTYDTYTMICFYQYTHFAGTVNTYNVHFIAYRLKCTSRKFYRYWTTCYRRYGKVSVCFRRLYKRRVFVVYGSRGWYTDHKVSNFYDSHQWAPSHMFVTVRSLVLQKQIREFRKSKVFTII